MAVWGSVSPTLFVPKWCVDCLPVRLPACLSVHAGETVSEAYVTEYSTDTIEMHTGAVQPGQRVLLVDDLIATGGTLKAGINLIRAFWNFWGA